ncbi:hypothetical protein YC2023_099944 [Brassica napus]|uniref:NADH:quinone oxidoreductase/Mrp antiporter membrane subunit domain-containing protein n=1 Tax=Brassica oleracea TaxID=3712 RepID=A0A3P6G452_BRAOL|nr:unnamed protein product [Brassica oleracea]VDD45169.1 unnamed protein product [Brassica oleracea]VDD54374.1 unnamed protein product [Brassica oleracea]
MFNLKLIMRKSYANIGNWLESLYLYILINFKFIVSSSASKSITEVIDQLVGIKSILIISVIMVTVSIFNRYIKDTTLKIFCFD